MKTLDVLFTPAEFAALRQRKLDESMFGVGKMGIIGQTPDRPYEERQREPGDYDACASQGPIANAIPQDML